MKRATILLAVMSLLLLTVPLEAQEEFGKGTIVQWFFVQPKLGMEQQFEEAYRDLLIWGRQQGHDSPLYGRLPLYTLQIQIGWNARLYLVAAFGGHWEGFYGQGERRAAAMSYYSSNVAPYVQSISYTTTVFRSDISTDLMMLLGFGLAQVVFLQIHSGSENEFDSAQKKIHEAARRAGWPVDSWWFQVVNGDRQKAFILLQRNGLTWSDFGSPPQKSLESILEERYGFNEASSLLSRLRSSIESTPGATWEFRPDLSYNVWGTQAALPPARNGEEMPQFPWPPPRWTSRQVLPHGLVTMGKAEPLGVVFERITNALSRAQIYEWSTYAVGTDGFAVVSRMEQIEDDGRPKPETERWGVHPRTRAPFTIAEYISALLTARPGRYRVIVLIVTTRTVTPTAEAPGPGTMERLLKEGAGDLPEKLRMTVLPPSGRCEALVYEFYRASEDDRPDLLESSQLQVIDHLVAAGLWQKEELIR